MASGKSTIQQRVMNCYACEREIFATLSTDIEVEEFGADVAVNGQPIAANAKVIMTGMRVSHDCIPTTKRSPTTTWESYGR